MHILKQNLNKNPVIYLNGVKYKNLVNLISFMHHGEVIVCKKDLESFLDVAKDLKVTGLSVKTEKVLLQIINFQEIVVRYSLLISMKSCLKIWIKKKSLSGFHKIENMKYKNKQDKKVKELIL